MSAVTNSHATTPGTPVPPSADDAAEPYCVRLGRVLREAREAHEAVEPVSLPRTVLAWEKGYRKPTLTALAARAATYHVPLLGILARAHDPNADARHPLCGPYAADVTAALVAFETPAGGTEDSYHRVVGRTMKALRLHCGIDRRAQSLPISAKALANAECGNTRLGWATFLGVCDAYGVGPLALLVYAAGPAGEPPVESLIACGTTSFLDTTNPERTRQVLVPDADTVLASLTAWAQAYGVGFAAEDASGSGARSAASSTVRPVRRPRIT